MFASPSEVLIRVYKKAQCIQSAPSAFCPASSNAPTETLGNGKITPGHNIPDVNRFGQKEGSRWRRYRLWLIARCVLS